jgi:pimeloyl-ACP methyl ester carboxylesterase
VLTSLPDGRVAEYWLGGADEGPVVLFFHGCPDTRWAAMTGAAAAREVGVRLLSVNRPGYGRSTRHESSHATVTRDALAVLDHLGVERVAALGMSAGGAYAATLAARHPHRVGALGVVAALPMDATDTSTVAELVERFRAGYCDFVAGIDPDDQDDRAVAARWLSALPEQDAALLRSHGPAFVAGSVREALAEPDGYLRDAALLFRAWPERVEDVRCPTRLWYGGADERARPGGDWFAARISGAELVVRSGASHWETLAAHWSDILGWLARAMRDEAAHP